MIFKKRHVYLTTIDFIGFLDPVRPTPINRRTLFLGKKKCMNTCFPNQLPWNTSLLGNSALQADQGSEGCVSSFDSTLESFPKKERTTCMQSDYYNYPDCYTDSKQPTMGLYSGDERRGWRSCKEEGRRRCHSTPCLSQPSLLGTQLCSQPSHDPANLAPSGKEELKMLRGNTIAIWLYTLGSSAWRETSNGTLYPLHYQESLASICPAISTVPEKQFSPRLAQPIIQCAQ